MALSADTKRRLEVALASNAAGDEVQAAIDANTGLAHGKILVGDTNGNAAEVNMSGDATIADTGAVTLAASSANVPLSTSPTKGIGYAAGAGGAVTQATNRTTGVTVSTVTGQITTNNAGLAAAAFADFVVTNTAVAATDIVAVSIVPGGTGSPVAFVVNVGAGSFTIRVLNQHAATADTSADVINFAVIKGVIA